MTLANFIQASVLPDSFRRSPLGKGMVNGDSGSGNAARTHHPGSIVRVKLTDFVTYTNAEFHPGPNLNMIIGPNGTGKSTLVCAICLGLGWATSHLGRAKELGEFVKHGSKSARIQIELAADPARHSANPVVTTKITKEGSKAEYLIDDRKSNKKGVQELAQSFNIQVDNLCQFLPQDRVVEFAGLSPVDLLTETQRAAAPPSMTLQHEALKKKRKDQKQRTCDHHQLVEDIKSLETRHKRQEADVERIRDREKVQESLGIYEKLRPFPEFALAQEQHEEAISRMGLAEKELSELRAKHEPRLRLIESKKRYHTECENQRTSRQKLLHRSENMVAQAKNNLDTQVDKIQNAENDLKAEISSTKEVKQSIPRHRQDCTRIEQALQNPPAAVDTSASNERLRALKRDIREINDKNDDRRSEIGNMGEQIKQRQRIVQEAEKQRESLQSQAGKQTNKLRHESRDAATAWAWIQANRAKFEGEVFGPPIIECTVKNPRHAAAFEAIVGKGENLAFTVTSRRDFDMLQKQLYDNQKLNNLSIRTSLLPLSHFRPPIGREDLKQYGLEAWVLDLVDGPEPVLAMLCDNRGIHQTAYTPGDINDAQFAHLKESPLSSWVTSKNLYIIARRREYGALAASTRVSDLGPAQFYTDMPVDLQAERDIQRRIDEANDEIAELRDSIEKLMDGAAKLQRQRDALREEEKSVEQERNVKTRQLAEFRGLETKLKGAQHKLSTALETQRKSLGRQQALRAKIREFNLGKGQTAVDYANKVEALRCQFLELYEAELMLTQAKSDSDQLRAQHADADRLLKQRTGDVELLKQETRQLQKRRRFLETKCAALSRDFSESEQEICAQINEWSPDKLEAEIATLHARLECLAGGGTANTIKEYEERARRIQEKNHQSTQLEADLNTLKEEIAELRQRWEPALDRLIEQISDAFSDNFSKIQCAGEVAIYKDDDFEQWAIQIKVKFRYVRRIALLCPLVTTNLFAEKTKASLF